MNNLIDNETIIIEDIIYEVRGKQVMLDSDLAKLYKCSNGTKDINKAVKRNIKRFPEDFYFQLTDKEINDLSLRFQTGTLNKKGNKRGVHIKYLPYVFTEQGVAMLASVLHTDVAIETSLQIMRSFVKMRRYFSNNLNNNEMLFNHENRLLALENTLDKFKEKELNKVFFKNELYDAYSLFIDLLAKAKKEIIIIDNYASKELLDILKDIKLKIIIVSQNIDDVLIKKYKSQFDNVAFVYSYSFHDRFIIIDRNNMYISGASFKDLGKKCFGIHEINDIDYLNKVLKMIN